ncbi:glycosyltransferase family 2 protein [Marinobacter persicus]|uniref:Glycosyltransferase involved in cell wall biosynthesis n=1 Tax=Marinobacter persicus TaxID=930118 RepID=A0A2S6G655_9GAMM|nr:glycosyltransferase family 2 protein [Marinobacter persicus]PPK51359.1 glycosyltransferase involved in cell wall biosynthesis [Marinobacter persicus]PPK54612.1 glycosyltransferase involved in cell wall biosynthesis [Marinobacter persicus]PPK58038.1 glycosyltransferase involved in cell wall biosynthesis [Marinobacter persicus]
MSTFNGCRYLDKQIESILDQSLDNVKITVRDDGSTDGTVSLLNRYSSVKDIEIYEEKNVGVVGSFFELIYKVDDSSQFVAFSDQDDFWHQRKLEAALDKLSRVEAGKPAMYCSRTRLVDENLRFISLGRGISRPVALENAVIQNIATGCTIVLNREAVDILKAKRPNIRNIKMHDWWVYLVISGLGEVIFDNEPYIDYRQHDSNVIGGSNGLQFWLSRFKRIFKRERAEITIQLQEFLENYSREIPVEQVDMCRKFIDIGAGHNFFKRMRYALISPLYRQSRFDDLLFRILLVLGYR